MKDEIECEERGHITVRGIAYPIMTYRAVGLKSDAAAPRPAIRTELPHLKLDADPERMSAEERNQAAIALRDALARIAKADN